MAERRIKEIDDKVIKQYWQARFDGSIPGIKRRFRYSDIPTVIDDIVRIREDQGGYKLTETMIPIELSGAEGPIVIFPRFRTDHLGGYTIEMGLHDEDDNPLMNETWDIVDGFKEHRKRRTAVFMGSQLATCGTTTDPMELERKRLTPTAIGDWVDYVWQAHLDTPPDF
jgi:hypothetical protein